MVSPRVTVLMSVYNGEQYVREAVQSILNQTFTDFEFLIFEDASTDCSRGVLRQIVDPRIRLVENPENLGLTRNLVRGMEMARGDFVARMDADDIAVPHRLEVQFKYMARNPEIGLLGSAVTFFDGSGWEFVAHQPEEHEHIKCALLFGYTLMHPTVMMRRHEFTRHRLNYDVSFPVSQDHDLWVRASRVTRLANLHESLVRMREHAGKIGFSRKRHQHQLSDTIRRRQFGELSVTVDDRRLALFRALDDATHRWTWEALGQVDAILMQLIAANEAVQIFDGNVLQAASADRFRGACRNALLAANRAGLYYWKSEIRVYDSPTMRQRLGLALRSLPLIFRRHQIEAATHYDQ